ncbi:MAG: DUF58 domain-containing protein [Lachnospiraceae bacterium]|nr:DUF58 domain-containing protein [Lachnospiraceae bacterium]
METEKHAIRIKFHPLREVGYFFMLVICLVLYFFLHSHFLLTAIVLLILFPVLSLVMAYRMAGNLSLRVEPLQIQIKKNDVGNFVFYLDNPSWWMSLHCALKGEMTNMLYQTGGALQVVMPVSMHGTEEMTLPISSKYSGNIQICVNSMEYLDLSGLFTICKTLESRGEMVVMPSVSEEAASYKNGFQAGVSELEESQAKGNDFAEVTDMREYQPGDRIKDIHWKLSAKKEQLMVKERTSVAQSQIILVLDLSGKRDITEEVMAIAYSVTKSFLMEYTPVRLLWWNEPLFDFDEVMINSAMEVDKQFIKILHNVVLTEKQDLVGLVSNLRPYLQAFVVLGEHNGVVDGEVIQHA